MAETYEERGVVSRELGAVVGNTGIRNHDRRGGGDGQRLRVVGSSMTSGRTTGALPSAGKQS